MPTVRTSMCLLFRDCSGLRTSQRDGCPKWSVFGRGGASGSTVAFAVENVEELLDRCGTESCEEQDLFGDSITSGATTDGWCAPTAPVNCRISIATAGTATLTIGNGEALCQSAVSGQPASFANGGSAVPCKARSRASQAAQALPPLRSDSLSGSGAQHQGICGGSDLGQRRA